MPFAIARGRSWVCSRRGQGKHRRLRADDPRPAESDATTRAALDGSRPPTVESHHTRGPSQPPRAPRAPAARTRSPARAPRPRAVRGGCAAASGVRARRARHRKPRRERRRPLVSEITKSRSPRSGREKGRFVARDWGYTRGVHAIGIFRLIPVWVRFSRRGEEAERQLSMRPTTRFKRPGVTTARDARITTRASGCTQRRRECETRRRATLRVYTREARGPPRAGLGARHRGGASGALIPSRSLG